MPSPSLLDLVSVVSSAARIARRTAAIQTAQWASPPKLARPLESSRSRLPSLVQTSDVTPEPQRSNAAIGPTILLPPKETVNVVKHETTPVSSNQPEAAAEDAEEVSAAPFQPAAPVSTMETVDSRIVTADTDVKLRNNQDATLQATQVVLKPSRVPSSRLARLFHYGGLAAGLGVGAASEYLRRRGDSEAPVSLLLSEANVSRLVDKLSKMRGAALKLGQFLSIQDAHVLPPQLEAVFQQLQNKANYMPNWQMEQVMMAELGANWKSAFQQFNPIPVASASIGQVHRARLATSGIEVAVKVQFPDVAKSISSDLANLSLLLTTSSLLPRGLFLQNTIETMQQELVDECDYEREASYMTKFAENLKEDPLFRVPRVMADLTTKRVLVMEWMEGLPLTGAVSFDQSTKNEIASAILELCLREMFEFGMMQTDPNWTNFLWNNRERKIELIDFGATREYSKVFLDQWLRLLRSAIAHDREGCLQASREVGYLTGEENDEMISAHLESMFLLGLPFRESSRQPYQFRGQTITTQIKALIPIMLRNRLTPPPRETYSLNRMLSGAFLLCARLDAEVACSRIWHKITDGYGYGATV